MIPTYTAHEIKQLERLSEQYNVKISYVMRMYKSCDRSFEKTRECLKMASMTHYGYDGSR